MNRAVRWWRSRSGTPSLAMLALVGLVSLCLRVWSLDGINGGDLDVYLRAGDVLLDGGNLYAVTPGVLPFTYSPFAALVLSPLSLLSRAGAYLAMTGLSLLAYAVSIFVIARTLRRDAVWATALGLLGLTFEPVFRTVALGQVNLLLMVLVAVDLFAVRESRRGWLVGVACGSKIIPGVFVLVFLLRRQWGAAVRAAAGLGVTVLLGAVVEPSASWVYWSGGFADLGRFGPPAVPTADNQALVAVWARLTSDAHTSSAAAVLTGLVAVSAAVAAGWRHREVDEPALVACIALGGLLASPVSWTHHWVWCVPVLMVLVARGLRWWAAAVGFVFWLGPMWVVLVAAGPAGSLDPWEQVLAAAYPVAALMIWAALAGWPASRVRPVGELSQDSRVRV